MRLPGLSRPPIDPRDPEDRRRDRRADRAPGHRARDRHRGACRGLPYARRRRRAPGARGPHRPRRSDARGRSHRPHGLRLQTMALYTYKAVDAHGKSVMGRVEAVNLFDLEQRLSRMDLDLISGAPSRQKGRLFGGGVERSDLINFCFHLEQLANAGVPVMEGLADLRESVENARFREVVAGLVESIEGGRSLSQALAEFPEVFSKVFVSLVRSGEQTGKLSEVLTGLIETLKWEDEIASQTRKLLMYPIIVGTIVLGVTFFLMLYIVPQMVSFIRSMGQAIPWYTQALIFVSEALRDYWWAVLAAPFAAWFALKLAMKSNPAIAYAVDSYKLRMLL